MEIGALHLKYRPRDFKSFVGNKDTLASLESILTRREEDRPHAMLFTGPSGTGKTTLARIVAARLGIADADLRELNIANTRGIDNAREIQEQMRMRPMAGTARGWILDEVHQSTKDFQHAMLKTLEDTPTHVYFFLCTTDPQKLLPTIKTRCHEFRVESLGAKAIVDMLTGVAKAEKVNVPVDVLTHIAGDANGSARAALVCLDKIIDMPAADMLAAASRAADETNAAIDLCRVLIKGGKWMDAALVLKKMGEYDPEAVRQAVMGYCQAVLLKDDNARAWTVLDAFRDPFDRNGRPGVTWACYMAMSVPK